MDKLQIAAPIFQVFLSVISHCCDERVYARRQINFIIAMFVAFCKIYGLKIVVLYFHQNSRNGIACFPCYMAV